MEWKPAKGFEGFYEVSSDGRVRRVSTGRVLKPGRNERGYHLVSLSVNGVIRTKCVHHLVTDTFMGPCPEGMERCHGPNGKDDNSVANLRFDTHRNNMAEAGMITVSDEDIPAIIQLWNDGMKQTDIAKRYGTSQATVSKLINGKTRR